ncbi:MAG: DUF3822 family protein [Saprospiraceae bacterium]
MIGLLTSRKTYVAQTSRPLVVEDVDEYADSPSLVPDRFVSISTKFANEHQLQGKPLSDILPRYLNEEIVGSALDQVQYLIRNRQQEIFRSGGIHWSERIDGIRCSFESNEDANVFVICIRHHALVFVRKEKAIGYTHGFEYQGATELLYWLTRLFQEKSYDTNRDRVILMGEIQFKREAYAMLQPFFKQVWVEDLNPLAVFEMS